MSSWYVARTKTGFEDRAIWHLENQGFEVYLPRYRKQVRHARKTRTVLRPLFPGYVFLNMDLATQRWRSVNGTVGVVSLVQFGGAPGLLPDGLVDAIKSREAEDGSVAIQPDGLKKGDLVHIREGAFADYTAVLDEVSDEKRVYLMLDLMGRQVRVRMPSHHLVKAS